MRKKISSLLRPKYKMRKQKKVSHQHHIMVSCCFFYCVAFLLAFVRLIGLEYLFDIDLIGRILKRDYEAKCGDHFAV